MTTYNTGNPVPSPALEDLYDNAENLDTAVNDKTSDTWVDRLGRDRLTWEGMTRLSNLGASVEAAERAEEARDVAISAAELAQSSSNTVWVQLYSELTEITDRPNGTPGVVTNDPDPENNGYYLWDGSVWIFTGLQPATSGRVEALEDDIDEMRRDMPQFVESDSLLGALVDAEGNASWLAASKDDGGVPSHSEEHIRNALGLALVDNPDYLFALADEQRVLTSLAINKSDGDFAPFVYDRITRKVSESLPPSTASLPIIMTDQYVWNDEALPLRTDLTRWALWGSSSAQGFSSYAESLSAEYGVAPGLFFNGGQPGEAGEGTAARQGGIAAVLSSGGVIPSSGSVDFSLTIFGRKGPRKVYDCTIMGVAGSAVMTGTTDDALLRFTRQEAGDPVAVPAGTRVLSIDGESFRDAFQILNIGKNSMQAGFTVEFIDSLTVDCFNYLSPLYKNSIVVGHFYNSDWTDPNRLGRVLARGVNDLQRRRYGKQFFDLQALLVSSEVWDLAEIDPTPGDLAQQAQGVKPDSLSADNAHLNASGYLAWQKGIRSLIDQLGLY